MSEHSGIYEAVVADVGDPLTQGRARLQVPAVLGPAVSAWARPLLGAMSTTRASVGDKAWVLFENGDLTRPTWISTSSVGDDTVPTLDEVLNATPPEGYDWATIYRADDGYWSYGPLPLDAVDHLVAGSEESNAGKVVRSNDLRLSNSRPPTAHNHPVSDITGFLDRVYPVGAYYISHVSTSPATLFGGTWVSVTDRVLIGVGSNVRWDSPGETGGSETITLTAAQSGLPAHGHGTTQTPHSHSEVAVQSAGVNSAAGANYGVLAGPIASFTGAQNANITVNDAAAQNASAAHDNMPPFIAAYMWRRTA